MNKIKASLLASVFILAFSVLTEAQTMNMLPRSTPEAEGVSSKGILKFVDAIAKSKLEWHSFMLIRHGKVVAEGWWNPYKPDLRHSLYSVSKSFTSTAIGFAVAEKKLTINDKVVPFFPTDLPDTIGPFLSQLTIKDLLIMASGHDPEPTTKAMQSGDWAKGFFYIPLAYKPGTKFLYNTLATYMLSAIIQKVTGQKLMDYLTTRLFEPLGIKGIDWEESPQKVNTGGFGLRIKTEDMAKFGQFYLQNGMWNGKQLLPKQWITEATTSKIDPMPVWVTPGTPRDSSDWMQGYGYQFWRCRHNAFRADGLAGQFIIVMPEEEAVLAITAEVANTQSELNLVWQYLLPALHKDQLSADAKTAALLKQKLSSLALPISPKSTSPTSINNKIFTIESNDKGIQKASFQFSGDSGVVTLKTGSTTYSLVFGSGIWKNGETMKEGPYAVGSSNILLPFKVAGSYNWKDDKTLELVLRYIETPHRETIVCHFDDNGRMSAEIVSSKAPGKSLVLKGRL